MISALPHAGKIHKYIVRTITAVIIFAVNAVIILICGENIFAQSRGEGVGALLGKYTGNTEVTITNGKASPGSSIFIENRQNEIYTEAVLDSLGVFTFSFTADKEDIGSLFLYGQDTYGQTNRIRLIGTDTNDIILSPTIQKDIKSSSYFALPLVGGAHPGSTIDVVVEAGTRQVRKYSSKSDDRTGVWRQSLTNMEPGTYTVHAKTILPSGKASEISRPLTVVVEIPVLARLIDILSKLLILPAIGLAAAPTGLGLHSIGYTFGRILLALKSFLFIRRQKRLEWGIVYDAMTKSTIPGVIVRLYTDSGGLTDTEVTGSTGTFSFLPVTGRYFLQVLKPGYKFPSRVVSGTTDGEYGPLYHGETFTITDFSTPFILSVPLDSNDADAIGWLGRTRIWLRQIQTPAEIVLLGFGLALSIIAYIFMPRWLNGALILLYAFLLSTILFRWWNIRATWGIVSDEQGKVLPSVSLSLVETTFQRQVKHRVTDLYGRYQFIVSPGQYRIAINSDTWEIVPGAGQYSGEDVAVNTQTALVIPKIVLRKKG